jgi:dipeptidyl aminopeptidase/acylaminoacyl peptidase
MKSIFVRSPRWNRLLVAVVLLSCLCAAQTAAKRPITHRDYAGWKSIQNQKLSPDGKFLGYALFPQEGDGVFVVRNLASGVETREPIGAKPAPVPPNPLAEIMPELDRPTDKGITVGYSADSRFIVFTTFPTKADTDKAKREKKKAEEMPKGGLVVMDLSSGAMTRAERVKSFQLPERNSRWLVYVKEPVPEKKPKSDEAKDESKKDEEKKKKEYGGELVVRDLKDGSERTFAEVADFTVSKDGAVLVYAVSSKKEETNGVYEVTLEGSAAPTALVSGKGKYAKLTWDDKQAQIAFISDRDGQDSKPAKFSLYRWDLKSAATVLVAPGAAGIQKDYVINEKGAVSFSRDGRHLFFGVSMYEAEKPKDDTLDDDKASADLWSWHDDHVQSMQRVRLEADKIRSYKAVVHLDAKRALQLGEPAMMEIVPSEDGLWAVGVDNREYRPLFEYGSSEHYSDSYLINTLTGEKKIIAKKHVGSFRWSPDSRYMLNYDGKDWWSTAVPSLVKTNLTEKLGVKFGEEDDDHPDLPPAYGVANWTRDAKYVLIYDRYDVWQISTDGKIAKNLTAGVGRKEKTEFRYVRVNPDSKEPEDKWIDPTKPLLLKAENEETRDSGFYRTRIDSAEPPQKLMFAVNSFSSPVMAKDKDVMVFTESRFDEYPDLRIADTDFKEVMKVSDANPQRAKLLWGTAELVRYRNVDGVPLKAALYKPENFDPKKKYPMLVYLYEKLSQNVNQFVDPKPGHSINISYYVSNGYLVLTPDIVYTVGHPGQSALKCVLAAVDAVVDRGYVDEKAIGIQGHSWGGYQIAYMITQTGRFRAAAAGAPVSNMISAYNGIRWGSGLPRQFQYEHSQSRIGGTIWEYPLRYVENSPIFAADRVETPLLMLHNDNDDAVPWYQGIEYFLALRRLGKEVYMFSYNGEPHGLRRRADQKDYTVRLQQFFDHFLKGAPPPDWMLTGIPYLKKEDEKIRFALDNYGPEKQEQNAEKPGESKQGQKPAGNAP